MTKTFVISTITIVCLCVNGTHMTVDDDGFDGGDIVPAETATP